MFTIGPAADKLQVFDQSDRLVLLQKVAMMRANLVDNSNGRSPSHQGHTPIHATHNARVNPKVKMNKSNPATNNRGNPVVQNGTYEDATADRQSGPHISQEGSHVAHGCAVESPMQHQGRVTKKKPSRARPRVYSEMGMGPELPGVSVTQGNDCLF